MLFSFEPTSFVIRFRKIRYNHGLSAAEMAKLLGLKSASSITNIDRGSAAPSLDFINTLSMVFAVNPGYLLDISFDPYTEDSVLNAESAVFRALTEKSGISIGELKEDIPYFEENFRINNYSLPTRANIVYLMWIFMMPRLERALEKDSSNPLTKIKARIKALFEQNFPSTFKDKRREAIEEMRMAHYKRLVIDQEPLVIYDITKNIDF